MRLGRERPRKEAGPLRGFPAYGASMRLGRERPRKGLEAEVNEELGLGFNEAGARTPQKGAQLDRIECRHYLASMRLGRERPRKHAGAGRPRYMKPRLQ